MPLSGAQKSLRSFKSLGFRADAFPMDALPPLILLVLALVAVAGVIECIRALAVVVRDETRIHDLMVNSGQAKIDYIAAIRGDDEVIGVDIIDD